MNLFTIGHGRLSVKLAVIILSFWGIVAALGLFAGSQNAPINRTFFTWSFDQQDIDNVYAPPQFKSNSTYVAHYFGTDAVGRDVAAGIFHGAQITLTVALLGFALTFILGFLVGAIAGFTAKEPAKVTYVASFISLCTLLTMFWYSYIFYLFSNLDGWIMVSIIAIKLLIGPVLALINQFLLKRGFKYYTFSIDSLLMRLVEIFQSVPLIMWLLGAAVVFQKITPHGLIILVGLTSWMGLARLVRSEFFRLKTSPFVDAAKAVGASTPRIILKHILPNMLSTLVVATSYGVASVIGFEALISYIGLGLPVEEVTWGTQLSGARQNFAAWWLAVFPGLAIFSVIFALNVLGNAARRNQTTV